LTSQIGFFVVANSLALETSSKTLQNKWFQRIPATNATYFNEFQQLLLKADFLDFAPLRCVDDSYGLAHMPVWC